MIIILALAIALIGVSLGISGIGGFLIPPLLISIVGTAPRVAIELALISFIPSGLFGAFLYRRSWEFSRELPTLLSLGVIPGVALGRFVSLSLNENRLQVLLGIAVFAAAVPLIRGPRHLRSRALAGQRSRGARWLTIAAIGFVAGLMTVLAGVGGPLVTVPSLLLLGVDQFEAVGSSLIASVVGSTAGAIALSNEIRHINSALLGVVVAAQLAGVFVGVRLQARFSPIRVSRLTGAIGACAATWLVLRSLA